MLWNFFLLDIVIVFFYVNTDFILKVKAIGCYKCSTLNNDTACIDPFNPGSTSENFYEPDCKAGIQDRIGLFPARYCLKVSGYRAGTDQQVVIRTCTVMKLLDSDASHSSFTLQLDDKTNIAVTSGLIASCKDDGCNDARKTNSTFLGSCFLCLFALYCFNRLVIKG